MLEELNYQEMSEVIGGVSAEVYCETLKNIVMDNKLDEGAMDGARHGYNLHCK